jgi:hypothetical protein
VSEQVNLIEWGFYRFAKLARSTGPWVRFTARRLSRQHAPRPDPRPWPWRILALGVYLIDQPNTVEHISQQLRADDHIELDLRWIALGSSNSKDLHPETVIQIKEKRPKFDILNEIMACLSLDYYDYIMTIDDDVTLPIGFCSSVISISERHCFDLFQPARTYTSTRDHLLTLQRPWLEARRTLFVEIGPVFCFRGDFATNLVPFDGLSPMGYGYEFVWAERAQREGWRLGIIDATPMDHSMRPQASQYDNREAMQAGRALLEARPHLSRQEARVTLERFHRRG